MTIIINIFVIMLYLFVCLYIAAIVHNFVHITIPQQIVKYKLKKYSKPKRM